VEKESIKELAKFLEERVKAKINVGSNEITVKPKNKRNAIPPKAHLRVLLRKFLHQTELKEDFRVISSGENVLTIKTRRKARSSQ